MAGKKNVIDIIYSTFEFYRMIGVILGDKGRILTSQFVVTCTSDPPCFPISPCLHPARNMIGLFDAGTLR